MFFIALLASTALLSKAKFLTSNVYSDIEGCSDGHIGEMIIPTENCMSIPPLPDNVTIPFQSIDFDCSENSDGSVDLTINTYMKDSCGGVAIPIPYTLPAGCNKGNKFSCGTSSNAVSNGWPAVAGYEHSQCAATPLLVASFIPDICTGGSIDYDGKTYTGSATISMSTTIHTDLYNSADCSGDAAKSFDLPINTCTEAPEPPAEQKKLADFASSTIQTLTPTMHRNLLLATKTFTEATIDHAPMVPEFLRRLFDFTTVEDTGYWGWAGAANKVPGL